MKKSIILLAFMLAMSISAFAGEVPIGGKTDTSAPSAKTTKTTFTNDVKEVSSTGDTTIFKSFMEFFKAFF